MDDMNPQDSIDFFDFLYEIWQAKWMFLLIVIGCTALAATGSLLRNNSASQSIEQTTAQFGLSLRYFNDPYQRDANLLMGDLVALLDPDGTLGLHYTDPANPGIHVEPVQGEDRRFEFRYIGRIGVGYILLDFQDQEKSSYQNVYEEFLRASEQQFIQAKEFAEGILESYKGFGNGTEDAIHKAVENQVSRAVRFLETPSVKNGTFRFFDFRPLEIRTTKTNIGTTSSRTLLKTVVLGIIIGFMLACTVIMFRIAINRKRNLAAKVG